MTILRTVAQFALDLNKIQTEALVKLYKRLGLYRRIYEACGLSQAAALRLEEAMLAGARRGVQDQHDLLSRWVRGETDFSRMTAEYETWFTEYMGGCIDIAMKAAVQTD